MESVEYKIATTTQDQSLKVVMDWKKNRCKLYRYKKDKEGKFIINPPEETVISAGMKVIVLGTKTRSAS